jgi:hypothetical protein
MNKLRLRILTKLAQTQPAQPTETPAILGPVPAVPGDLLTNLYKGYNTNTVPLLTNLTNQLNAAMHYASKGQDNFTKIIGNNMDLSGATPDQKNVGSVAKRVYTTFLNSKNPFVEKIDAVTIHNWADALTSSPEYNALSQINPTSLLATKLQGNLKTEILNLMTQIKQQNPVTS